MTSEEVIKRLALAFNATAASFRDYAPELPSVCEQIGYFLEHPKEAEQELKSREARDRKRGVVR